jgi:hypothetical protein
MNGALIQTRIWTGGGGTAQFIGDTYKFYRPQSLLPILVIQCNRVVSISRPQWEKGFGLGACGGNTEATRYAGRSCQKKTWVAEPSPAMTCLE